MLIKSEFLHRSGVYCITNIKNGKQYIGSSKNIWQRLQCHRSNLRKAKHFNEHLKNAWCKYGEDSFICSVIEYCSESILEEKEQFYLDNLKPQYNSVLNIERPVVSIYSRNKQSNTRKKMFAEGKLINSVSKEIFKYSLDGNFIEKYSSIIEAAKKNNIHVSAIYRFLKGQYKVGGKFLWSYSYKESLPKYTRSKRKTYRFKVELRDYFTNNLITTFENMDICAQNFNTSRQCIIQALRDNSQFRQKYRLCKIPLIAGTSMEDNQQPSSCSNTEKGSTTSSESQEDNNSTTKAGQSNKIIFNDQIHYERTGFTHNCSECMADNRKFCDH